MAKWKYRIICTTYGLGHWRHRQPRSRQWFGNLFQNLWDVSYHLAVCFLIKSDSMEISDNDVESQSIVSTRRPTPVINNNTLVSILLIPGESVTGLVRILYFQDLSENRSGSYIESCLFLVSRFCHDKSGSFTGFIQILFKISGMRNHFKSWQDSTKHSVKITSGKKAGILSGFLQYPVQICYRSQIMILSEFGTGFEQYSDRNEQECSQFCGGFPPGILTGYRSEKLEIVP